VTQVPHSALSNADKAIGTVIALAMATAVTVLSSGSPLIVTFVPGMVFARQSLSGCLLVNSSCPASGGRHGAKPKNVGVT
jgi:hypothetical protein